MRKNTPVLLLVALLCVCLASCSRQGPPPVAGEGREHGTTKGTATDNPLTSAAEIQDTAPDNPFVAPPDAENANWAILTKAGIADVSVYDYDDNSFQGIWQPSQSDVRLAIQQARLHLQKLAAKENPAQQSAKEVLSKWDKYLCQAVGHTKDGRKLILLNFFPRAAVFGPDGKQMDWRHRYVEVSDGGNDFWRINYDRDTNECLNLESNGDA
jgi:hypothetical protein